MRGSGDRSDGIPDESPLKGSRLRPGRGMPDDGQAMTTLSACRMSTRHAPLPVLRAAVFALVGTVLGVSAHHVVTEASMPWRHGAAAAAVLFAVGLVGTRRRRSTATVVAVCGAAQL